MPFERPSGTAPFTVASDIRKWAHGKIDSGKWEYDPKNPPPYQSVFEKANGFHVHIKKPTAGTVTLLTKKGYPYNPQKTNRLGVLGKIMLSNFTGPIHQEVVHPEAGRATNVYAELTCDTTGDGDNLQAMMHGDLTVKATWRLRVFDCDFANARVKVVLADKLTLFREALGPEFVVRTLIDTRYPVTQQQLDEFDDCMTTTEGVVAVSTRGGWKIKFKTGLPFPLWLVAVGFTEVGTVFVPTHFAWAIRTEPKTYAVVLIDNKGHLCDLERKDQKKMYISPMEFNCERGYAGGVVTCSNETFAGKNYASLLSMAGVLIEPTSYTAHKIEAGGNVLTVNASRKDNFSSATFKPVKILAMGTVTANECWLNKGGGVGDVHFQAPQFAACLASKTASAYGHPIHQMLLPGYTDPATPYLPKPPMLTPTTFLQLAKMPRNVKEHARLVYGVGELDVDLVHGEIVEMCESSYSTPQQSEDEDDKEFLNREWEDSTRLNKRARAMGLQSLSSVL